MLIDPEIYWVMFFALGASCFIFIVTYFILVDKGGLYYKNAHRGWKRTHKTAIICSVASFAVLAVLYFI